MLVLTRRHGESVRIGPDIRVTVVSSGGGQVRIAIDAPEDVGIFREEIFARVAAANVQAASMSPKMSERMSDELGSGFGSTEGPRRIASEGDGNG